MLAVSVCTQFFQMTWRQNPTPAAQALRRNQLFGDYLLLNIPPNSESECFVILVAGAVEVEVADI